MILLLRTLQELFTWVEWNGHLPLLDPWTPIVREGFAMTGTSRELSSHTEAHRTRSDNKTDDIGPANQHEHDSQSVSS